MNLNRIFSIQTTKFYHFVSHINFLNLMLQVYSKLPLKPQKNLPLREVSCYFESEELQ